MPASLKFESTSGTAAAADLSNAKIAIYEDSAGIKYKVNFYADNASPTRTAATGIDNAKVFVYADSTNKTEYIVDNSTNGSLTFKLMNTASTTPVMKYSLSAGSSADLGSILKLLGSGTDAEIVGKLLSIVNPSSTKTVLAEKVAEQGVVKAIVGSTDFKTAVLNNNGTPITDVDALVTAITTNGTPVTRVHTQQNADTKFVAPNLSDYLKTKDLEKEVEKPAVAKAILGAKEGQKSVLVTKLGEFLDKTTDTDKVYGTGDQKKIAKDFLGEKSLKPTAAEVAADSGLQTAVKNTLKTDETFKTAVGADQGFQTAVKNTLKTDETFKTAVGAATVAETLKNNEAFKTAVGADPDFQKAVAAKMLEPTFEIPTDPTSPLSWDW